MFCKVFAFHNFFPNEGEISYFFNIFPSSSHKFCEQVGTECECECENVGVSVSVSVHRCKHTVGKTQRSLFVMTFQGAKRRPKPQR